MTLRTVLRSNPVRLAIAEVISTLAQILKLGMFKVGEIAPAG